MSEFINLFQQRQGIRNKMRYTRRRLDPQIFLKMKDEEKALTDKMNRIIQQEKK